MRVPARNVSVAEGPVTWGGLFLLVGPAPANSSQEGVLILPTFLAAAMARVVITLVLCVVSTACNMAVLWAGMGNHPGKRSHARVLLLHLAGADLLVALVVMPLDDAWNITVQWWAGDVACRLLMFFKLLAMYASAFVTALMSLDRQAAILHTLAIMARGRGSLRLLPAAWLLSAGLSIPQLFLFHTITIRSPQNFTQCTTQGSFPQRWHETAYNMLTFSCLFLLPLLIMVSCYSRILLEISNHAGGPSDNLSATELPLRRSYNPIPWARLRMLRLSMAVVGSFVICWTPYYLLGFWYWFWPAAMEGTVPHSLAHLLFVFGLLNACLDPITYSLFAMPLPQRLRRCCGADRLRLRSQPTSPIAGSLHCSSSTIGAQRGRAPHLALVEPTGPPRALSKDPTHSSCM